MERGVSTLPAGAVTTLGLQQTISTLITMIPGLPPLPQHLGLAPQPGAHLALQALQQAWLSRAQTSVANSFVTSPPCFPFANPFLPLPPVTSSPELLLKTKLEETAEDLSSSSKRFKADQAVCPICSITMKWEELPEHFETELKCLDDIRSLSPIARPQSASSSYRPYSTSPLNKSGLSASPTSPSAPHHHTESRWQRFENIRRKRRERIGAKQERDRGTQPAAVKDLSQELKQQQETEADIDIGDSLSDSGSHSDSDSVATYGPLQYTEADVLRCLSEDPAADTTDEEEAGDENANTRRVQCPTCRGRMTTPVLNVSCWHLKCEQCWLRAVGTKKVCSICNGPASVKELRKVHL